jgi:CDP-diacylglycerol--glycerol-3-phosphate 3-phosphatidyltransferase
MEKKTKKTITIFAIIAGVVGFLSTIVGFFLKRQKKVVIHNGKKKMLYPQDLVLEKSLLRIIPDFIKPIHFSFLRIILTPLAAILIANGPNLTIPLIVYLFVSFTDLIDGALARTRDEITDLGKIVDPVADKLLFAFSAMLLLPQFGQNWLLLFMIGLEFLNIIMAGLFYQKGADIASNIFGKIKMNLQVLGIVLFLIAKYQELPDFAMYGSIILYLAIVFHLASISTFVIKRFKK